MHTASWAWDRAGLWSLSGTWQSQASFNYAAYDKNYCCSWSAYCMLEAITLCMNYLIWFLPVLWGGSCYNQEETRTQARLTKLEGGELGRWPEHSTQPLLVVEHCLRGWHQTQQQCQTNGIVTRKWMEAQGGFSFGQKSHHIEDLACGCPVAPGASSPPSLQRQVWTPSWLESKQL